MGDASHRPEAGGVGTTLREVLNVYFALLLLSGNRRIQTGLLTNGFYAVFQEDKMLVVDAGSAIIGQIGIAEAGLDLVERPEDRAHIVDLDELLQERDVVKQATVLLILIPGENW